ncbi:hypothetical protein [Frischella perrara]|uniref:hypothetical protein n=2 Tax=Frischella perrara TaxID=1267021 RepID=UPI0023F43303|nr:hypothetical protein [Frischella perrara]
MNDQVSLSKEHSDIVDIESEPIQVYISPETEEIIIPENPKLFEDEWRLLHYYSEKSRQYEELYSESINLLNRIEMNKQGLKSNDDLKDEILAQTKKTLKAIENQIDLNFGSINELVNLFSQSLTMLEEEKYHLKSEWETKIMKDRSTFQNIVELLPVMIKDPSKSGNIRTNRFAYLRKFVISEDRSHRIKIRELNSSTRESGSTRQGSDSIIEEDRHGNKRYNLKKLTEQLTTPQATGKLFKIPGPSKSDYVLRDLIKPWAEELENILSIDEELGILDISGGAQFMRYAYTAQINGDIDLLKGRINLKGELSGEFALAKGAIDASIFIPDRLGILWQLEGLDSQGRVQSYPIGHFRCKLGAYLTGFIGASVGICAQLSVQVVEQNGVKRQVLSGNKGGKKNKNFKSRNQQGNSINQQIKDTDAQGTSFDASGFLGARAEVGVVGALQWLKPLSFYSEEQRKELNNQLEFEDFASANPKVGLMAGIGGGVSFYCQLHDGKILIRCHASLCCGVGAKGSLEFTVDFKLIKQFLSWFAHQLFWSNYSYLEFIASDTFEHLKYMMTLVIGFKKSINDLLVVSLEQITGMFKYQISIIDKNVNEVINRNQLAENILNGEELLLFSPPESKGMLIALLMQVNALDKKGSWWLPLLSPVYGVQQYLVNNFYTKRSEAIIKILHTIQTQREWVQVMKNIELDTEKLDAAKSDAVAAENEQKLREFLSLGFFNLNSRYEQHYAELINQENLERSEALLTSIKNIIAKKPAYGCPVILNTCPEYQLRTENDGYLPWRADLTDILSR